MNEWIDDGESWGVRFGGELVLQRVFVSVEIITNHAHTYTSTHIRDNPQPHNARTAPMSELTSHRSFACPQSSHACHRHACSGGPGMRLTVACRCRVSFRSEVQAPCINLASAYVCEYAPWVTRFLDWAMWYDVYSSSVSTAHIEVLGKD